MAVRLLCSNPQCGASASEYPASPGSAQYCEKCGSLLSDLAAQPRSTKSLGPADPTPTPIPGEPPRAEPATEFPRPFGRYTILGKLGRGGMGVVYLADDPRLDRQIALKIPLISAADDSDFMKRFFREAQVAAKFHHPNICPIYDMGTHDGRPFLSLAYIEGQSLAEHLKERQSSVEPTNAAQLVRILALAIQKAHDAGIIHRDLKPGNIMISGEGRPIVMDFGLARRDEPAGSLRTRTGQMMGTPAYMPLEQYRGDVRAVGPGSDIYSLGVILYELLTSRLPYEGSASAVFEMLITGTAPPRPSSLQAGIDPSLEAICLKAMAREIRDRYPSMTEFAEALGGWLQSVAGGTSPQPKGELTNCVPRVKPAGVIDALGLPKQSPVASHLLEPAVTGQLVAGPRKRRNIPWRWFYLAALPVLAFLSVISYIVTDSGNKKAASTSPGAADGSKPASPTTHVEASKPAPPAQKPQPRSPQPEREWTNSIGMRFVHIEAGEFLMGTTKDQVDLLPMATPEGRSDVSAPDRSGVGICLPGRRDDALSRHRRSGKPGNRCQRSGRNAQEKVPWKRLYQGR
jgi:serine/threonine protein kinase